VALCWLIIELLASNERPDDAFADLALFCELLQDSNRMRPVCLIAEEESGSIRHKPFEAGIRV
jgi:hypothetical protein